MKPDNHPPFVYITPYYEPNVHSGANRRFVELYSRFYRDYPNDFTLIVAHGKIPPGYTGKVIEVDYEFNHLSKFKATQQIAKALDSLPPSIVICESIPIPFKALKRHTHFQVAYDFRYFRNESKGFFYRLLFSSFLKQQWSKSEFMVTCSNYSIDELKLHVGYDPKRVTKSYFGIDEKVLDIAHTPAPTKDVDIIYVGHYEKRKNHEPLLRAIALIDKNLKVRFIGRDLGLKDSLTKLKDELGLTNTSITTENIPDSELWDLYRRSRVFAYPSVYEGFGIPLIEALALDIPVVCTDMNVFHEVGNTFASFFNPNDPADIAEKIKMALENPITPPAEKIRSHLEKFFWENIYNKFVEDLILFTEKKKRP
ncbi:MAG: glycosyltransferase [Candidatus Pacebacteria bacterium]|nr:glycosyltransferase [Candidatus Paceibacterota bacterium]MBP9843250.1 glycosyltransferase [Candidatus Paceibacterota bacterium]